MNIKKNQDHSSLLSKRHTQTFDHFMHNDVAKLWESRQEGQYYTADRKKLAWCSLTAPHHSKAIVVINGRAESYLKYQEVFYDLFSQGFDVYSYDHRGQGLSQRLISDPHIGYVGDFHDYVDDLTQLVSHWPLERYSSCFLLAHSMGSTVAIRYLQTHPSSVFKRLAVCSPMLGFDLAWYIKPFAPWWLQLKATMSQSIRYVSGYGPYQEPKFDDNLLSHDPQRYAWFRQLYQTYPQLQLGGPSQRWAAQSLIATKQCWLHARQLLIPCLLLQAQDDKIVSTQAQHLFINKLKRYADHHRMIRFSPAKHELLFEQDSIRDAVITQIIQHFSEAR